MPLQYPGEFVPIILWVGGVAGSSFAAHEANRSAEQAAHKIDNQYNCRRLINCINFFLADVNVKPFLMPHLSGFSNEEVRSCRMSRRLLYKVYCANCDRRGPLCTCLA